MVEGIKIKIRHELGFNMIYRFGKSFQELITLKAPILLDVQQLNR